MKTRQFASAGLARNNCRHIQSSKYRGTSVPNDRRRLMFGHKSDEIEKAAFQMGVGVDRSNADGDQHTRESFSGVLTRVNDGNGD